jgi:hypothetical protein
MSRFRHDHVPFSVRNAKELEAQSAGASFKGNGTDVRDDRLTIFQRLLLVGTRAGSGAFTNRSSRISWPTRASSCGSSRALSTRSSKGLLPAQVLAIGDDYLVYTFTASIRMEGPDEAFRARQPGMEQELRILEWILEGWKASRDQLASTRNCGEQSSKPRMTSVAFPGAA